ncbi:MAG: histidinol dehydrogenase [Propionibacteriaceae bacterium]|nr:histidinol dehydrogenase [Propionibacteriaceae bacterium]
MRLIDCRSLASNDYAAVLPRGRFDVAAAAEKVAPICEAVRIEGEAALRRFSQQFDHVVPDQWRVDPATAAQCAAQLDPDLAAALRTAIERRRAVSERELLPDNVAVELAPGADVAIRSVPVERVGLYVPGGLAPLASSVIMNVVPAQVAGVRSLAVASPPQADHGGLPHPTILAVCHMLGVEEIYAVGGAQAIAMFAYGVDGLCASVDMITGPGNIYVVAAKRLVKGLVGIDSEAGPTEIAVLADDSADPRFVAADLLSQAEHDPGAGSVLVTMDEALVTGVETELERQLQRAGHGDRVRTALSGPQSAVMVVRDLDQGIDIVNAYAAEHLEIQTRQAGHVASRIHNAGAIFVGGYSPVPLGDYSAGSTHVLPTSGTARHSSGLTVRSFLKTIHVIDYSRDALADIGASIERFALAENLPGHAHAIAVRLDDDSSPGGPDGAQPGRGGQA